MFLITSREADCCRDRHPLSDSSICFIKQRFTQLSNLNTCSVISEGTGRAYYLCEKILHPSSLGARTFCLTQLLPTQKPHSTKASFSSNCGSEVPFFHGAHTTPPLGIPESAWIRVDSWYTWCQCRTAALLSFHSAAARFQQYLTALSQSTRSALPSSQSGITFNLWHACDYSANVSHLHSHKNACCNQNISVL